MATDLKSGRPCFPGDPFVVALSLPPGCADPPPGSAFRPGSGLGYDFAAGDAEATTPGCFVTRVRYDAPAGPPARYTDVDVGQVVEGPFPAAGASYYFVSFVVPADWGNASFLLHLRWRDRAGRVWLTPRYHATVRLPAVLSGVRDNRLSVVVPGTVKKRRGRRAKKGEAGP